MENLTIENIVTLLSNPMENLTIGNIVIDNTLTQSGYKQCSGALSI